jgi:hypothetical protein
MIPNQLARGFSPFSDCATDLCATGSSKHDRDANAHPRPSNKAEYIANGVVFAGVQIPGSIAKTRHLIARPIHAFVDAVTHVCRETVGLLQQMRRSFKNGLQNCFQPLPPFPQLAIFLVFTLPVYPLRNVR